jgi:hypothetical protein
MAVAETLELEASLRHTLDRDLDVVIVNGLPPNRFTPEEMTGLAELDTQGDVVEDAVTAARAAYLRARIQRSQIGRLRKQRFAEGKPPRVLTTPFKFVPRLDRASVEEIARQLRRNF